MNADISFLLINYLLVSSKYRTKYVYQIQSIYIFTKHKHKHTTCHNYHIKEVNKYIFIYILKF